MTSIREFFEHQNVLVTGGTGFVGKVLLEKLLRSCPDVGNIYVLMRKKRGKEPSQRALEITDVALFDVLKRSNPDNLKKIVPLLGDCMEIGLGLSPSDRQMIEEKVSAVFHCAATVSFDNTLKHSVILNVRGTREVMLLARNMKELKVVVHVSTCYSNCDRRVIDEVIYPTQIDWKEMIDIVENISENTIDILTSKILGKLPNTYVFTKSLAENVVKDLGVNFPVVVVRPSIVMGSINEPLPGWIDSLGGPIALSLGASKGILRAYNGDHNAVMDIIPVDTLIKIMCSAAREKAVSGDRVEPSVYNACSYSLKKLTWGIYNETCFKLLEKNPLNNILWIPGLTVTKSDTLCWCILIFFQISPSAILHGILKLNGKKSPLLNIQRKLYRAVKAVKYFSSQSWEFRNNNLQLLRQNLLPADTKEFNMDDFELIDFKQFFSDTLEVVRQVILKEPPRTTPEGWTHYRRMYWLNIIVRGAVAGLFIWNVLHSGLVKNLSASA